MYEAGESAARAAVARPKGDMSNEQDGPPLYWRQQMNELPLSLFLCAEVYR